MNPEIPPLGALRDPAEHAHRRRPWTRAFNSSALNEYQPKIALRVLQLVDKLSNQKGVVNLSMWIGWFTYDFMSDMA